MKVKINTSNYIPETTGLPPNIYFGELEIFPRRLHGIQSARGSILLINKFCFSPNPDSENYQPSPSLSSAEYLSTTPRIEISTEQIVNTMANCRSFRDRMTASIEGALLGSDRKVFEDSIVPTLITGIYTPQVKLIFLKKSPGARPCFIGFLSGSTLVLYRPMFVEYSISTPEYCHPDNFRKLHHIICAIEDLPLCMELTLGADPELSLYESENVGVNNEECIIEDLTEAQEVLGRHDTVSAVGTDGCAAIFEIRPTCSNDPQRLTENIEKCLKVLVNKIATSKRVSLKHFFLEAGGGATYHIGGHIHFGNQSFANSPNYFMSRINQMMDDFIYRPIRRKMYGAVRGWLSLEACARIISGNLSMLERMSDAKKSLIEATDRRVTDFPVHSEYDHPSQSRPQKHGFEYRSLPSFIASKEFTEIILNMAMGIGRLLLESVRDKKDISYNTPVTQEGYELFTTTEIFKKFMHYINGDKRDLFLQNVIKGWNINPSVYKSVGIEASYADRRVDGYTDVLNDVSLQLNEAIFNAGISLDRPIAISVEDLGRKLSAKSFKKITSIGVFLSGDSLHRTVIYGGKLPNTKMSEAMVQYCYDTVLPNPRDLVIGIGNLDLNDEAQSIKDIVLSNFLVFIRSSLHSLDTEEINRLLSLLLNQCPCLSEVVANFTACPLDSTERESMIEDDPVNDVEPTFISFGTDETNLMGEVR